MPSRAAAQVVTIHDLNFLSHPERTRAEIRRDYPALARDHAHRADAVLVPSAYTAGEVERLLGVPRDRIGDLPARRARLDAARPAAPKDGYVLFFGTLEPRKNVGGLLDAYEQLLTAGYSRNRRGSRVRQLRSSSCSCRARRPTTRGRGSSGSTGRRCARTSSATSATSMPADRRALYEARGCCVQPSFDEGFGMPVLEAMSLGVPVVAAEPRLAAGSARRRRAAGRSRAARRHRARHRASAGRRWSSLRRAPRRASRARARSAGTETAQSRVRHVSRRRSSGGAGAAGRSHAHRHRRARVVRPRRPASAATWAGCCANGRRTTGARSRVRALRAGARSRCRSTRAGFATRDRARRRRHLVGAGAGAARSRPSIISTSGSRRPTARRSGSRTPTVVAIHDLSFVAHPEWFRLREGAPPTLADRAVGEPRAGGDHDLGVLEARADRAARRPGAQDPRDTAGDEPEGSEPGLSALHCVPDPSP